MISYSQMRQIFKFRQVGKLQVERVNDEPAVNRNRDYHYPQHCHCDVVEENQVVDDGEEKKREESKADEDAEAPEPWNDSVFVFLSKI